MFSAKKLRTFILADSKNCQFSGWLLFTMEIITCNFHSGYCDCGVAFQAVVDLHCVMVAENKVLS